MSEREIILGQEVAELRLELEVARSAFEAAMARVKRLEAVMERARDVARSRLPCDALGVTGERFLENKLDRIAGIVDTALRREMTVDKAEEVE